MRWLWFASILIATPAWAAPVRIVAAEDVYAAVAREIAGPDAIDHARSCTTPIRTRTAFEASASIAHDVAVAQIAEVNGADYDPVDGPHPRGLGQPDRQVIDMAALLGRKPGDNPHLWFDPAAMPAFAGRWRPISTAADPANKADHATRLDAFLASLQAARRADRGHSPKIRRDAGDRDRADFRPALAGARPDRCETTGSRSRS